MEKPLDDGARCLPKLSTLFSPSQSEIVLYPKGGHRLNSKRLGKEATPSDADNPIDSLPAETSDAPITPSVLQSIPDEAIVEFTKIVNAVRSAGLDETKHEQDDAIRQETPNEDSTADSSPQEECLNTRSPDTDEFPFDLPLFESASYYVFNPRSLGSAYYLHRSNGDEADTAIEFQISKVPITVVIQETGEPVYMVSKSKNDYVSSRRNSHDTLWPPKAEVGHRSQLDDVNTSSIEVSHELPYISERGGCSFGMEEQFPLAGLNMKGNGLKILPSIMAKVHQRLQPRRHLRDHVHVIDDHGKHVSGTSDMFLVNKGDIRNVVGIVIEEMHKSGNSIWEGYDIDDNPRNHTMLKLDGVANIIIPPPVTAADPATTFSLPQTSYASLSARDLQVHTKIRGMESETTATIVSRRSIAEITWSQNHPHVRHPGIVAGLPSCLTEEPLEIRHCDNDIFVKNPFCTNPGHSDTVFVAEVPQVLVGQTRFGASIGSASHRRRSSPPAATQSPTADPNASLLPSLMDKIRQGSHKIFHRHHSQKGSEEAATLPDSEENGPADRPRPRDSLSLQKGNMLGGQSAAYM
ncbi:hypothetical protein G7Z17_g11776 [Cylindrodendrum hubeiense]|uniref:Uncharacterized protein n=1 Tax=Cylindrodendrum hubeiense TaxID=595255 RepID=A0A9P5L626_9HYPO|nr:hypothetical protein G7Z17_g11776 [Cylindrodendrum hubeiense]